MKIAKYFILLMLGLILCTNAFAMEQTIRENPVVNKEHLLTDIIKEGDLDKVKQFLDREKINVNIMLQDKSNPSNKKTPLMIAAAYGHEHIVRYLIQDKNAFVNVATDHGTTALIFASYYGYTSIVKFLIEEAHANRNALAYGLSALFYAVQEGKIDVVKYLIESNEVHNEYEPMYHQEAKCNIVACVAMSIAHERNHQDIIEYFIAKGFFAIPKFGYTSRITSLFPIDTANARCQLNRLELLAYNQIPIPASQNIAAIPNGGMMYIYQPKVLKQSSNDACIEEQLQQAVDKLGGTKKMHTDANPILGGTCAYHATKNALLTLLMLHDYDVCIEKGDNSEEAKKAAVFVASDIESLQQLKTTSFDSELFIEKIHAKTFMIKHSIAGMPKEAIDILQSFNSARMHIAHHEIDDALEVALQEHHGVSIRKFDSSFSFIDASVIRNVTRASGSATGQCNLGHMGFNNDPIDSLKTLYQNPKATYYEILDRLKTFELLKQIALFRTNNNYRHAFILTLNPNSIDGWGEPHEIDGGMHAITVTIDKRESTVNIIVCESNNLPIWAMKKIVYDFLNLFIDVKQCPLDPQREKRLIECASNPIGFAVNAPHESLPQFTSLVETYVRLKNACEINKKREDLHYAFFLLSELQHIYNKAALLAKCGKDQGLLSNIQSILIAHNLFHHEKDIFRQHEIELYTIIESVEQNELNERLFTFIRFGTLEQIKDAIITGANINSHNGYTTPLGQSIMQNNQTLFESLIELGADIEGKGHNGHTPLMIAAEQGRLAMVEYLLNKGANAKIQDNNGFTPMMYAASESGGENLRTEIIRLLIDKGHADYRVCNNVGNSALDLSIAMGDVKSVKYFINECNMALDLRKSITLITEGIKTPTSHLKTYLYCVDLVDYLIKNHSLSLKENPDIVKQLFFAAVEQYGKGIIKRLLEDDCGMKIDIPDDKGYTALMHTNYVETVKYLIEECHADIKVKNHQGQTVFYIAMHRGDIATLEYFIKEHSYTIESADQNGFTPLLHAAATSNAMLIEQLVEQYSANLRVTDNIGRTPLMLAAGSHMDDIQCHASECLLNKTKNHWFFQSNHLNVVQYLVEHGCDINAEDNQGFTALMHAASAGRLYVVEYLVKNKAAIHNKNLVGKSALDLAHESGHVAIVHFLENPTMTLSSRQQKIIHLISCNPK